ETPCSARTRPRQAPHSFGTTKASPREMQSTPSWHGPRSAVPVPQSSTVPPHHSCTLQRPPSSSLLAAPAPLALLPLQPCAASPCSFRQVCIRRALSKQRRSHLNPRRALFNRNREIAAHPHRQLFQSQSRMLRRPLIPPLPQAAEASPCHILGHA